MCAPASPHPFAPRALISAALRSGRSSRKSSAAYDAARNTRLLPCGLGDWLFRRGVIAMDGRSGGGRNSHGFDSSDDVFLHPGFGAATILPFSLVLRRGMRIMGTHS